MVHNSTKRIDTAADASDLNLSLILGTWAHEHFTTHTAKL